MSGRLKVRACVWSLAFFVALAAPAHAQIFPQAATPAAPDQLFSVKDSAPDVSDIPALANLASGGGKLYYLGERSGLNGFLLVRDGRVQMLYLSPDRKTVLIGAMFSAQGDNVTSPQVQALLAREQNVRAMFEKPAAAQPAQQSSTPVSAPAPTSENLSPGERLLRDMQSATSVALGAPARAEIYMLIAPNCPNCKATWTELKGSVTSGKLRVHLIPAYNSEGAQERDFAAMLLSAPNPLAAWNSFVAGDKAALAGAPRPQDIEAVENNLRLMGKWNVQGFPYLVYRGRDGLVKIVQGRPQRISAVLDDLPQ